jgi:hypothetical protein
VEFRELWSCPDKFSTPVGLGARYNIGITVLLLDSNIDSGEEQRSGKSKGCYEGGLCRCISYGRSLAGETWWIKYTVKTVKKRISSKCRLPSSELLGLTCRGNYASFWKRPVPVSKNNRPIYYFSRDLIGHLSIKPAFSLAVRAMEASLEEPIRVAVRIVQKRRLGCDTEF